MSVPVQATPDPAVVLPEIRSVQLREQGVRLQLWVNPALGWFAGHFPQVALLPGVVQTHWVTIYARQYVPTLPPRFVGMSNMKFMRFIFPGATIELDIEYRVARQEVVFEYREAGAVSASGRMSFAL